MRKQKGQLIETKKAWFLRYYTTEIGAGQAETGQAPNALGQEIRKQTCVRLCEKSDVYRHASDVRPLVEQYMTAVNAKQEPVTGSMLLGEYVTRIYLPWVKSNLTAATYNGYRQLWNRYLSPRFSQTPMIDLQTHEVTALLTNYAQSLGARTLSHIKWMLSGIYVFAIGQGTVPKGSNPAFEAKWQAKAKRPRKKIEYSVKQIIQMIDVLKPVSLQAACAVAVCYFAAASPAECRGLRWEDWTGDTLEIRRGIWRNHVGDTKNESSVRTQKVKKTLRDLLTELREQVSKESGSPGSPVTGFIFQNSANKPLSLDSLSGRIIAPTLKKAGIAWEGYYPARRGMSSKTTSVSKNPLNSTGLLGHSNPATALEYYTRPQADDIDAAQDQVEELAQIELRKLEQEKVSQSSAIN